MSLKKILRRVINKLILRLALSIHNARDKVVAETLPKFANNQKNLSFDLPRTVIHPERMQIGDDVKFGPGCMLKATLKYPGSWMQHPENKHVEQQFDPQLVIGDRVTATSNLHLNVTRKIVIGDDVMFASNVFLSDSSHGYENADIPFKYQGLTNIKPITIKSGVWIGQNVVVMPGVTIGKNTLVGANSVVSQDLPDKCIAFGIPARVHKIWDEKTRSWVKVKNESVKHQDAFEG